MAKRQKDIGEWKIVLEEPEESKSPTPSTPSRRSKRNERNQSSGIKLERESDHTIIQVGDCVLLDNRTDDSYVAIIIDIQFGIRNFLDVSVLPFTDADHVRSKNVPKKSVKHELFIVPEVEMIKLAHVVEKVTVLDKDEFESVGDASSLSIYLCRRACDRSGEKFSDYFDIKDWRKLVERSWSQAVSFLAEKTLLIVSPTKARLTSASLQERLEASSPVKKRYTESSDDDSDDMEFDDSEDEDDEEEEEEEGEDNSAVPEKKERRTYKKRQPKNGTATPSPRKRTRRDPAANKHLLEMLSPLKGKFKVKSGASVSTLPSLVSSGPQSAPKFDTSSEAFKQLKEKLHTSARVASLPCREEEFGQIYVHLESAVREQMGCCIYVSGTPGVGKSATIREVVAEMAQYSQEDGANQFDFLEINCLKLLTPNSAYEKLWEHISTFKVTPSNAALLLEEYFSRDKPDEKRRPLVVLMDELDQIVTKSQTVMYNFFNWPTYANSKLIIIAVANTMDLPERILSNKIASRLGLRRIQFTGYTFQQLGTIIENRLMMLTEQNRRKVTIGPDAVGFASRKVASVSGDARRALEICRRAVEIAEEEYLDSANTEGVPEADQTYAILISHIVSAINETVNSPLSKLLATLSFASKLVLVGVLLRMRRSGNAENALGEVIDEMKNSLAMLTAKESTLALTGISESMGFMDLLYGGTGAKKNVRLFALAQIINELVEYGILIQQNIRSERHRMITLNISEDEVQDVLRKDAIISTML